MIATFPVGGVAWDYGQYALGLERMGFEVWYLEDTGLSSYDPVRGEYGASCDYGSQFVQEALGTLSPTLADRWHVRGADGRTYGVDADVVPELVACADVFINVSGGCLLREDYLPSPRKVLVDTDPGWNQFVTYPRTQRELAAGAVRDFRGHDTFLTYAARIGQPDCPLPTFGLDWQPTRPPVVADAWRPRDPGQRWTTVLTWDNYAGTFEHEGVTYGSKAGELARIEALPRRVEASLELAVGGVDPPVSRWCELGWSVVPSELVSRTADDYRRYVEASRGELSVAKHVYVATRSGWFSCRSVCYLAAGRPAVLQDTGFSDVLPTGEGLLVFEDLDEARAALITVEDDYHTHARAARELARQEFGHEVVLGDLLEQAGVT